MSNKKSWKDILRERVANANNVNSTINNTNQSKYLIPIFEYRYTPEYIEMMIKAAKEATRAFSEQMCDYEQYQNQKHI